MRKKALIGTGAAAAALTVTGVAAAQILSGVPTANNSLPAGTTPANVLASGWSSSPVAIGSDPLENPTGIYDEYGYLNEGSPKTRTEPDQNTYLVTSNVGGPTAGYDYGHRFLIQGHENGSGKAYFTRINLDVTDPDHRITLLATSADSGATPLSSIDGSVYNPFTQQLLFTSEAGSSGHVFGQSLRWGGTSTPAVDNYDGSLGKGGYEGVVVDKLGNIYLVEDVGGVSVTDNGSTTKVKQPNSFVYRFVPTKRGDLSQGGKLQVLQIKNSGGTPITFHNSDATAIRNDALGADILQLHSGASLDASFVTIHDTAVDGTTAFDANALAKAAGGTPLKRPENGKFVPGSDFKSFIITETGDTDKTAGEYAGAQARGSYGALLRLDLGAAGSDTGKVKTVVLGDAAHAAFDNVTFLDKDTLLASEDRGDTLHSQLNTLDSIWSFDLTKSFASINADAKRLLALGRDDVATAAPTENNEPTGILVSDGSDTQAGLIGTDDPSTQDGVRVFFTQQHGRNQTFQLTPPAATPVTGDKGPAGDKGASGEKGEKGEKGAAGDAGPKGPAGDKGATGATGAQGATGLITVNLVLGSTGSKSAVRASVPKGGWLTVRLSTKVKGKTVQLAFVKNYHVSEGANTVKLTRSTSPAAKKLKGKKLKAKLSVTFNASGSPATVTKESTVSIKG